MSEKFDTSAWNNNSNMRNIRKKEMHIFLVYKGLECVDLKEKNRKQIYDQLKKDTNVREKFPAPLKILLKQMLKKK